VSSRRLSAWRGLRSLGIGMLILSAIRVPLPQADYHNVRHHDAPGEICLYHDHLLRWHPSAASAKDVSLLHWHWFVPMVEPGAPQSGDDDDRAAPRSGPALHACLGDWPEPDWTGSPVIRPEGRGRPLEHLALGLSGAGAGCLLVQDESAGLQPGGASAGLPHGIAALRAARTILFQRWNC